LGRLLKQEFFVRHMYGDQPGEAEFRDRFPNVEFSCDECEASLTRVPSECPTAESCITPPPPAALPSRSVAGFPRQFGEYDLLEEIGRGGMGLVYKARQRSADRFVALKVIRNDRMDGLSADVRETMIGRFRTEAHAAALLEHDNIVTVYDVGEVDGHHYYSMRYVEGSSLVEMLCDGPIANRRAAEYMEPVARAVHVAHQSGVLHRDLKPHNVIVDAKSQRPLVADFGLAKLLEGHDHITHDGDVIGTPSYMSPEQSTDSTQVTTLSDVYALGATLYHLLTGKPPFQAATVVETIRLVSERDPVAPSVLNPRIDSDLETICLKCLQKDASKRYGSAEALADDLAHYLKNEPILARPVGRVERVIRWCRRNPATATASAAAMLFLSVALAASIVGYLQTKAALADAEFSGTEAREALVQVEERDRQNRATVDELFTEVSENVLLNQPGMQDLRKSLLQRTLKHYQRFVRQRGRDDSLKAELASTWFRIGRISAEVDTLEASLVSYREAQQLQSAIATERPDDMDSLEELARTVNAVGITLQVMDRSDQALASFQEAKQLRARLLETDPQNKEHQRTLANSIMNIGLAEKAMGNFTTARDHLTRSQTMRRKLRTDTGDKQESLLNDFGMGAYNLANLEIEDESHGNLDRAEEYLNEAVSAFKVLESVDQRDLENSNRLAFCYRLLGDLSEDALERAGMYRQAAETLSQLADENPRVFTFREDLAGVILELGRVEYGQGRYDAAEEAFARSADLLEPLVANSDEARSYQPNYASALQALSAVQIRLERPSQAMKNLEVARRYLAKLIEHGPKDAELQLQLRATETLIQQLDSSNQGR
jgi:serine/threonine-protein kinase